MDIASFLLFFLVVVPLFFISFDRLRKMEKEILNSQNETNRLLTELVKKMDNRPG